MFAYDTEQILLHVGQFRVMWCKVSCGTVVCVCDCARRVCLYSQIRLHKRLAGRLPHDLGDWYQAPGSDVYWHGYASTVTVNRLCLQGRLRVTEQVDGTNGAPPVTVYSHLWKRTVTLAPPTSVSTPLFLIKAPQASRQTINLKWPRLGASALAH